MVIMEDLTKYTLEELNDLINSPISHELKTSVVGEILNRIEYNEKES
jgi:hypothetical protein